MKKEKEYLRWFSVEVIRQAAEQFDSLTAQNARKGKVSTTYKVTRDGESWTYDKREDFYDNYGADIKDAKYAVKLGTYGFYVSFSKEMNATKVGVSSPERKEIEDIFEIFESAPEL